MVDAPPGLELVLPVAPALGLDMLFEPLGLLVDVVDPLGPDDDDALDAPPPCETPSADSVFESSSPVCGMPCACWNCFSALSVRGPILPSALPAS
jgi:hypothetical protein